MWLGRLISVAVLVASTVTASAQSDPYLGQIQAFGSRFCPVGWLGADGSLLPIANNDALFILLGTTYGGDGQTTFALPRLTPIAMGPGAYYAQQMTVCIAVEGIFPSQN